MLLRSARAHYRAQQRLVVVAIAASRRAWSLNNLAALVRTLSTLMERSAANGAASVADMLAEQGINAPAEGALVPRMLAETASDGRDLHSLLLQAKTSVDLERMAWTQVADAGRIAASVETAVRPDIGGYIRMLTPPSCSRCAVLAGKWYRWNDGFLRHPQDDCIHVPASENVAHDLTTNPNDYFDSLTEAEQDRIFTKAGAQAIRDGADISQVVNARRGMETTTLFGRTGIKITREGITRRGVSGRRLRGSTPGSGLIRLMPESIYALAKDREDAIRLLRRYGFIL